MARIDPHADVSGQYSSSDCRKATDHHDIQFGQSHLVDKRPNDQRSFRLPNEHIRSRGQRFRTGRPQRLLHQERESSDNKLHHTQVIQDGHKGRKENDGRQNPKRKRTPQCEWRWQALFSDSVRAGARVNVEQESGAFVNEGEDPFEKVTECIEHNSTVRRF